MHPPWCPAWEYDADPTNEPILIQRCKDLVVRLINGEFPPEQIVADCRQVHQLIFDGMAPAGVEYYVGNYRGASYPCLLEYDVHIDGDKDVGAKAEFVAEQMAYFVTQMQAMLGQQRLKDREPRIVYSEAELFLYLIEFACMLLAEFLRIHPYANGNGHIGRFLVWSVLCSFGHLPRTWPLNVRPPDPPYSHFLREFRRGNKLPLMQFVAWCVVGGNNVRND